MTDPNCRKEKRRHLLIGGTGRAGTSFLVRYLAELGLETHLAVHEEAKWHEEAQAGLEDLPLPEAFAGLPYVVKTPFLSEIIDDVLRNPTIQIECVIIPVRNLVEAASSRVVQELQRMHHTSPWMTGLAHTPDSWGCTPGGVVFSLSAVDQARLLAVAFHLLVERLTKADVPILFLDFPRLAQNADYLFAKLQHLLPEGTSGDAARTSHARIADQQLVRLEAELDMTENGSDVSVPLRGPAFPSHDNLDAIATRRELNRLQADYAELEKLRQRTQQGLSEAMDGLRQTTKVLDKRTAALELAQQELSSIRETLRISEEARQAAEQATRLLAESLD